LVTCSLGGVLLVLMVVLGLSRKLDFERIAAPQRAGGSERVSPFVIVAVTERGTEPVRAGDENLSFRIRPAGDRWSKDCQLSAGSEYAVLYSQTPPSPKITVHLQTIEGQSRPVRVQVYHFGRLWYSATIDETNSLRLNSSGQDSSSQSNPHALPRLWPPSEPYYKQPSGVSP